MKMSKGAPKSSFYGGHQTAVSRIEEIVRQQDNFSPPDAAREVEDYGVDLDGVTALELKIVPDISGGGTRGSLPQLRVLSSYQTDFGHWRKEVQPKRSRQPTRSKER